MTAVAAAQGWWAARRRRPRSSARPFARASGSSQAARFVLSLPISLGAAAVLCAAIGFAVTQVSESRLEASQHVALQRALDEFHTEFGGIDAPDDVQLRRIARRASLGGLRFDANATDEGGREEQSLHDARGRIVGWISWAPDGGLAGAMNRLWSLLAVGGAVLAACGLLALGVSRRFRRSILRSGAAVRKGVGCDALTKLPDRHAVQEKLDDALARRRSGVVVFAQMDLDGFREVNDTLGRAGGDAALKHIAEYLQAALPGGALLGRFGDEFAVIHHADDGAQAAVLGEALRTALQRPIFLDRMWQLTAGIGIAQAPADGSTGDELARRAGLALRAAKRDGRGVVRLFTPQIENEHAERRFLLRELQSAVALQEFDVHYQPVVAAEGGTMVGIEALLRWTQPTRGAIAPSVFIPLAEQSGLMSQLGEIVLRRALSDGARWPHQLSVAVNLSPMQIRDRWLVDLVGTIIAETGIASSRVVLEVTEGILIDNPQNARRQLEALRGLGVRIALDDFGTGYASLSYLQRFPFSRIKIDRAFVASLGSSGNAGAIVQSIVTLGHALGMKVVAEGVENDAQRVLLRLAGCDEMQGYLFAKPGPAADIDKMLTPAARAFSA